MMKRIGLKMVLAVCLGGSAAVAAEDAGSVRDPLDPASYGTRALLLRERGAAPSTGTEFNPALSLIFDFTYAHRTDELEGPRGFVWGHGHEDDHGHDDHDHGLADGLGLRGVELTASASVDPYFDAQVTFHFTEDDVAVEEAYVTTRMLPGGVQLKLGKFLSEVGYINKQHVHDWQFVDQPWMREYFFGEEGLNEIGVQASWLAPTETYLRLGVEALQGETEGVANYIGEGEFGETDDPRLFTGFAKIAPDLGVNHALQMGTFGGFSRTYQREGDHELWDGDAWFAGADFVYKYDGQGVMGHRNFSVQGEYIFRRLNLDYEAHHGHEHHGHAQDWNQDGLYAQVNYGFAPRWDAGLRLDVLGLVNDGYEHDHKEDFGSSYRYTGQIAYRPTEFSMVRAQAGYMDMAHETHGDHHDEAQDGWLVALQFSISLGVHGAHTF
jgi:hypothetical protein